ncbi:MAG TPA: hypothetical protein VMV07_05540 [Streptosporangiaceae bacterium]|nr:hypothetical protein [Streptosporangiaceae bacterium]
MSGPQPPPGPDELRELVREVLRDVLPTLAGSAAPRAAAGPADDDTVQAVRLSTDEELHAFVRRILRLADSPRHRRDLLAGRLRFTLADTTGAATTGAATTAKNATAAVIIQRVDKGAVTERTVIAAASAGARLVLGPRAVLTPLAKDKARALGVHVEKER